MRKDITFEKIFNEGGEKINVSATARQYNCSWLTIDKRVHPEKYKKTRKKRVYSSMLDELKPVIDAKLEKNNVSASSIYYLLKTNYDYKGCYSTVRNYVSKQKNKIIQDLTIRFETIPGYQAQVDWKESLTLYNRDGKTYKINIFLMVLGYSRFKYIKLTSDRNQSTLFNCLINAFNYFGGVTREIIFDNMKTVVDHTKSDFQNTIINSKFSQFAKDSMFTIFTCRPFRPRTKGKVETLAKVMNRLKAFDYEFTDWNELNNIVNTLMNDLNYIEKSQATNEIPITRMTKEKEYLTPVNIDLLKTYILSEKTYKVSKESMITYKGIKYSVPTSYVGKSLLVKEDNEFINIYFNTNFICCYNKFTSKRYNYKKKDYLDILKQSAYRDKTIEEISQIALNNLNSLNDINIEEE